ncbi:MAG: magnesium transporter [Planctomycetaceae bacterium]|nr:magnesium transporter [Planctomycetaceae bacterium]
MINTLFLPELREMLNSHNADDLSEFCEAIHPAATADFMSGLSATEAWLVLQHASPETRAEIFHYFDPDRQIRILKKQDRGQIVELLTIMAPDDRVDLLNEVDEGLADELVALLPADERRETLRLSAYPEDTAGAVMTTELVKLSENLTVSEALDELRKLAKEAETIYYVYVVDESEHLRGVLSARDLISSLSTPNRLLRDIMETEPITVDAYDDQEDVARKVAQYDLLAIPVVDEQHRMLGIITHDDVIDVVREEATEDAQRIGGVAPLEAGYLQTPIWRLFWKRGIWLLPLFFAALLTAGAIHNYDVQLEKWSFLIWFLPLVISSGGNSGNQSATLVITALTNGNVRLSDWFMVITREFTMGLLLGGALAMVFLPVGFTVAPDAVMVVPLTLLLVVVCGTLVGSALPLIFQRLGQDPALMSNPFVAGIVDIVGIIIYVNVAILILN